MKPLYAALPLVACLALPSPAPAQRVDVRGTVRDSATGAPLAHVRVEWSDRVTGREIAVFTVPSGSFMIRVLPGRFDVRLTRQGYAPVRFLNVGVTGSDSTFPFVLPARGVPLDPIVVSASRREQARLDAPASVSVIERSGIETEVWLDPLDQIRALPGVDFASKGLIQNTYGTRGPRTPTARGLLMLTDNRYAEVPAILSVSFSRSSTREDIDRIEVVRGPAAALYGPGAPQGILHIITRSPFESPGGVASLTLGGRSVLQAAMRYAGLIRPQLAFAVSVDYLEGTDWEAVDSVEIDNRTAALARGADADTLRIGRRDHSIRRAGGELRLDWRPGPRTELMTKAGMAGVANAVDLSGLGAVQLQDWRSWYLQSRVQHGGLLVNAVIGANDSGDTYYLRTGAPLVEESRMLALQLQHATSWRGLDLVYGSDVRATDPRTRGTVHGSYEDEDFTRETGAYLQATTLLARRLQGIGALRVDHHSRMQGAAFSPRIALQYKPALMHAVRLTYNRAFSSPYPNELFLDTRVNTLSGYPYEIRQHRVPPGGMTFARDCDGLCMHSPYGSAGADARLPMDATALWPEMVALLAQRGIDIGDIPAPPGSAVGTVLAVRNQGARTFEPILASEVQDLPPLRRQITNALEFGYLGALRGGATFAADLHVTRVHDRLVGSALAVTPNVFFDRGSLEQYLATYRGAAAAAEIATTLAQVPVGIITPIESPYRTDILLIGRQGQSYTLWGLDLSAEVPLGAHVSVSGSYSHVRYDTVSAATPGVPVVLIMPTHKGAAAAAFRSAQGTLLSSVRMRALGPIRQRGLFRDPTAPAYLVVDISASYRVPPARRLLVGAELRNVLDQVHREYPGGAAIGRLGLVRARLEF